MSDQQSMPTEQERIDIPDTVVQMTRTKEDLDRWVKAEAERRDLDRFWFVIPSKFRDEVATNGSSAAIVGGASVGSLAVARGDNERCGADAAAMNGTIRRTRRTVVARATAAAGMIAAALFLGQRKTQAQLLCSYCGNSCYFSEFYGKYVLDCYYKYTGLGHYCHDCCVGEYIGYGCNVCYTGNVSSYTCGP